MVYELKSNKMHDELIFHIDCYVTATREPNLIGLRFFLARHTENYYKDIELEAKLNLYLRWLEDDERYEECTYVLQMIKEHEGRSI